MTTLTTTITSLGGPIPLRHNAQLLLLYPDFSHAPRHSDRSVEYAMESCCQNHIPQQASRLVDARSVLRPKNCTLVVGRR